MGRKDHVELHSFIKVENNNRASCRLAGFVSGLVLALLVTCLGRNLVSAACVGSSGDVGVSPFADRSCELGFLSSGFAVTVSSSFSVGWSSWSRFLW